MAKPVHTQLSRRESQIMDAVYRLEEATVADVRAEMQDPPSYNSIRVTLGILEDKGYLRHRKDGPRFVYSSSVPREQAQLSALEHLLQTFFDGSTPRAVSTLLGMSAAELTADDLDELAAMIHEARNKESGR